MASTVDDMFMVRCLSNTTVISGNYTSRFRAISHTVDAPKIKNNFPNYFRIAAFSPKRIASGECARGPEDKGAISLAATLAK